jgi:lipopolysaccharide/colanic/teichoic acid biosynthesis glycosyltransferase
VGQAVDGASIPLIETDALPRFQLGAAKNTPCEAIRHACKRALDIGLSGILLLLMAPLFVAIAAAIKLDSRGPVFFAQERAGSRRFTRAGLAWWEPRVFRCHKFRSMRHYADDAVHRSFISEFVNGAGNPEASDVQLSKLSADERVTRVGSFLRRWSLDELPQLFDVLRGDMSLVGPRPVPLYEVSEYDPWHYERLAAKPGITGTWQVYGRGRVTFADMMRMDISYVRRHSLAADLRLLLLTLPAVLLGKGAR